MILCYNYIGEIMKRFNMIDEDFICENCHREVEKLNYTARDHCPYCLYSKHVDINPGDRENECNGLLKAIDIEKFKNAFKIIYKCELCGEIHKNIIANDDNMDYIIELSTKK
jgi:DNA-directed RNA polymerase subunit RPC12/RpoP